MAQGKLHSSPFHVENPRYIFAIEHETEDYVPKTSIVDCQYLKKNGFSCGLWNSGHPKCLSDSCLFYRKGKKREATCLECAYCFKAECFHPRRTKNSKFDPSRGTYCAFYYGQSKDNRIYTVIQSYCERIYCTRACAQNQQTILSKKKFVKELKKKLRSEVPGSTEHTYLVKKLQQNEEKLLQAEGELEFYSSRLAQLGGELRAFPQGTGSKRR